MAFKSPSMYIGKGVHAWTSIFEAGSNRQPKDADKMRDTVAPMQGGWYAGSTGACLTLLV